MEKRSFICLLLLTLITFKVNAQQARIQILHNAPDTAIKALDIYLGKDLVGQGLLFRGATPFVNIASGSSLLFRAWEAGADTTTGPVLSESININPGDTSIFIIQGLLNPTNYPSNPESLSTGLDLLIKKNADEISGDPASFRFYFHNGVPDVPGSIISWRKSTPIFLDQSFSYGDTTGTFVAPVDTIPLDLLKKDNQQVHKTFLADVTAMGDSSGLLFYSGFMDASQLPSSYKIGLFLLTPGGIVRQMPQLSSALVQFIHNSADTTIRSIDIFANASKIIDNLSFRNATAYEIINANDSVELIFVEGNSPLSDSFYKTKVYLVAGARYVLITRGVTEPALHLNNPEGISTGFGLSIVQTKINSATTGQFDTKVFHGVTDMKGIDMEAHGEGDIFTNGGYTQANTFYQAIPARLYTFIVKDSSSNNTLYRFHHDLSGTGDSAGITLLSGFINTTYGPALSMLTVLPSGRIVYAADVTAVEELPQVNGLLVYPNPAHDKVFICGANIRAESIRLYSLDGRQIDFELSASYSGMAIVNMEGLAPGVYQLMVQSQQGLKAQKIVKY